MALRIKLNTSRTVYERHLHEMARVGFADDLIVWVWTDDPGYIPHVHVVDRETKGERLDACIRLDSPAYFKHGTHTDELNASQRKEFHRFMHQPAKNGLFRTNYEYAVMLWNDNNSEVSVTAKTDNAGNTIVPDYSEIAES